VTGVQTCALPISVEGISERRIRETCKKAWSGKTI
jgi:hypothetical protein